MIDIGAIRGGGLDIGAVQASSSGTTHDFSDTITATDAVGKAVEKHFSDTITATDAIAFERQVSHLVLTDQLSLIDWIQTGLQVSKVNVYAVLEPSKGQDVSKVNVYAVLEPPKGQDVSKVNVYAVITTVPPPLQLSVQFPAQCLLMWTEASYGALAVQFIAQCLLKWDAGLWSLLAQAGVSWHISPFGPSQNLKVLFPALTHLEWAIPVGTPPDCLSGESTIGSSGVGGLRNYVF